LWGHGASNDRYSRKFYSRIAAGFASFRLGLCASLESGVVYTPSRGGLKIEKKENLEAKQDVDFIE
jgi:hypothetical protein